MALQEEKKNVATIIFPHAALYKYAPLSTLWCLYLYKSKNPFSDTLVTPRVSLFRPSH